MDGSATQDAGESRPRSGSTLTPCLEVPRLGGARIPSEGVSKPGRMCQGFGEEVRVTGVSWGALHAGVFEAMALLRPSEDRRGLEARAKLQVSGIYRM